MVTVFLDTTVYKYSATRLPRTRPVRRPTRDARGHVTGYVLAEDIYVNPNDRMENPEQLHEAELLEAVAQRVKDGTARAVSTVEVLGEWIRLPKMDCQKFYGAPVEMVPTPVLYGRPLTLSQEQQVRLVGGIQHPRFDELQRVTGAFQGVNPRTANQLLDAFHIWSAEHHACEFFLTLDMKLIKSVQAHQLRPARTLMVKPSQLLAHLDD